INNLGRREVSFGAHDVAEELQRRRNGPGCGEVIDELGDERRAGRELFDLRAVIGVSGLLRERGKREEQRGDEREKPIHPMRSSVARRIVSPWLCRSRRCWLATNPASS